MVTLFQTAFSSTSQITFSTIWYLAEAPASQATLRAELLSNPADDGPYLDAVFKEGVRVSRLASIGREAMEDTVLPLGQSVTLSDGSVVNELPIRACSALPQRPS